jgi:3-methyladenine DNA glycosylase AlkD
LAKKKAAPKLTPSETRDPETVVAELRRLATKKTRDGLARFAIPADHAFGVTMVDIRKLAKQLGRDHALAQGLWDTGWYEARMLTAFVDDPALVTSAQMDRWRRDFDNWAICDTLCFHLFDRTPFAWKKLAPWAKGREEFEKRASFALLWGLTVHDKQAGNELFLDALSLIEAAAEDDRNFVKKAVNMALRAIGKRNPALHAAAVSTAQRLADRKNPTARWNGKDALRELKTASVQRRLSKKPRA